MDDEKRRRWYERVPLRTLAVSLALIATILLTRGRWEAWNTREASGALPDDFRRTLPAPSVGRFIIIGRDRLYFCKAGTGEVVASLPDWFDVEDEAGHRYCLSPQGARLAVALRAGESDRSQRVVAIFDVVTGKRLANLETGSRRFHTMHFSPSGRQIVLGCSDSEVCIFDVDSGRELLQLSGHAEFVRSIEYSPNGERLLTASEDGDIRIWNTVSGQSLVLLSKPDDDIRTCSARFCLGGTRVVAKRGTELILWDARTGERLAELGVVSGFDRSPSGELVAAVDATNTVRVWHAESGGPVTTIEPRGPVDEVTVKFLPGSERLVIRGIELRPDRYRFSIQVNDITTGRMLFAIPDCYPLLPLSLDGSRLLAETTRPDGLWIIDGFSGRRLKAVPGGRGIVADNAILLSYVSTYGEKRQVVILRRIRPEQWWGVFYLWHFWLIVVLSIALVASLWRDVRSLRRR